MPVAAGIIGFINSAYILFNAFIIFGLIGGYYGADIALIFPVLAAVIGIINVFTSIFSTNRRGWLLALIFAILVVIICIPVWYMAYVYRDVELGFFSSAMIIPVWVWLFNIPFALAPSVLLLLSKKQFR